MYGVRSPTDSEYSLFEYFTHPIHLEDHALFYTSFNYWWYLPAILFLAYIYFVLLLVQELHELQIIDL